MEIRYNTITRCKSLENLSMTETQTKLHRVACITLFTSTV